MDIVKDLVQGNRLALARAITKVENEDVSTILNQVFKHTGNAYYLGITGPPGAGKSTMVHRVASRLLDDGKKVGIIAIDPTSPFSGGALLGDRIRMSELSTRDGVFIRSMASRGSLGGLAQATKNVSLLFDAYGMDYVIIETIGVGQVELDIAGICDTTLVILVPESGDSIQAMKAGLLEIADIIAVNKADREGADRMATELRFVSELRVADDGWEYPIMTTIATEDKGIDELLSLIKSHRDYLVRTGNLEKERKHRIELRIRELVEQRIRKHLEKYTLKGEALNEFVTRIYDRELSLFDVVDDIASSLF
jgi:LAO/AO transport system kinase